MELKMWDIGWLPAGWKRGDPLSVRNPNYRHGYVAALVRDWSADFAPSSYENLNDVGSFVFALHLTRATLFRIEPWLIWYFYGDSEAYRIIAQIQ